VRGAAALLAALLLAAPAQAQPAAPTAPPTTTPTPPTTAPTPPTTAPAPPKVAPIAPDDATGILGKKVRGPAGEDMGTVVDVIVDEGGAPRAAVIDFGGFLGVGNRKIAIDWHLLQFNPVEKAAPVTLSMGRAELQAAPEYKPPSSTPVVVQPPPAQPPPAQPPPAQPPPVQPPTAPEK
jgi:hypothetical protein